MSLLQKSLFYRALLQKRPIVLRSLLIVATPYMYRVSLNMMAKLYTVPKPQTLSDLKSDVSDVRFQKIEKNKAPDTRTTRRASSPTPIAPQDQNMITYAYMYIYMPCGTYAYMYIYMPCGEQKNTKSMRGGCMRKDYKRYKKCLVARWGNV